MNFFLDNTFGPPITRALALIVGGGFLAAGGRAMTRGDWANGGIAVGFGVILIIAFFALGKTLGLS